MRKIWFISLILVIPLVYAVTSSSSINWLTKGYADILYEPLQTEYNMTYDLSYTYYAQDFTFNFSSNPNNTTIDVLDQRIYLQGSGIP